MARRKTEWTTPLIREMEGVAKEYERQGKSQEARQTRRDIAAEKQGCEDFYQARLTRFGLRK
ncbi:hypothetical protein [Nonomuraea sp. NPDC049141]|uniref:hypothetical protein n=1 Tax=Nonomuraea sp. NPDC049141 TaxID=3155500 RepID=UPI0033FECA66